MFSPCMPEKPRLASAADASFKSQALKSGSVQALAMAAAPFFGLLLSWLTLGEQVQFVQLLAGALMASGIALMLFTPHSHHHIHEAMRHTHSHRHDDGHHDHVHEDLPRSHRHTHEHEHEPSEHNHPHRPDLHHRHEH